MNQLVTEQRAICKTFGSEFVAAEMNKKLGLALPLSSEGPAHGLRHPPEGDTTGWYIWTGELSDREDFFQPLHCHHLASQNPEILRYLGLAPGWRFLITKNHQDVWFDPELLNI